MGRRFLPQSFREQNSLLLLLVPERKLLLFVEDFRDKGNRTKKIDKDVQHNGTTFQTPTQRYVFVLTHIVNVRKKHCAK